MTGRHRRFIPRLGALVALLVSLGAVGMLLLLPEPTPPRAPGAEWTLGEAYPGVVPRDVAGFVGGGWAYQPMVFLGDGSSLGAATAPDASVVKLVLLGADGRERTLRTLRQSDAVQFGGVVTDGRRIAWLEQTAGADGSGDVKIWTAEIGGAARVLTGDVGDFVFFNSMNDMVINGDRLLWAAAAPTETPRTEIRSVPLGGGSVSVTTVDGGYALAGGDWLVSAITGQTDQTELRHVVTTTRITVDAQPSELITCSPAWCRALVLGGDGGATRIDVMHPDGSGRVRAAAGAVTAALVDVGVLDRWEIYSRPGIGGSELSSQQLLVYDLDTHRLIVVADGVGQVLCRAGVLFWSSGQQETLTWHALDLHRLA
ncbi:hypothetical protein F4553_004843 [Allocatelliglobosispora scoriae]|uniref:WD40 repeat domain-containing protein n=1 Tax=Allocatelliglobosispora scoriae TaxID=643052 RepID=A0A841BTD3_9ACTN|nr:hypothetical protein [Allocatelliglobosispora scoriae]MBB5871464.1 hypothetical protein [Allocatelliglobosispora scoriae]